MDFNLILLIGIDGAGNFPNDTNAVNLTKFMSQGLNATNARCVFPSDSAENWGSILHGVLPDKHNIRYEDLLSGNHFNNDKYPSIFKIIQHTFENFKVASFASWRPINSGIIEDSDNIYKYSPMKDECFFVKTYLYIKHYFFKTPCYDDILVYRLLKFIKNKNNLLNLIFVHLTDIDEVGHAYGYESNKYNEQIKKTDSHLASIIESLRNYKVLTIITTDHGGLGNSHGGNSDKELDIFLTAFGGGIQQIELTDEVRNMDVAAFILELLKIDIPANFDAKPILYNYARVLDNRNYT